MYGEVSLLIVEAMCFWGETLLAWSEPASSELVSAISTSFLPLLA
jgi:hypothetical protein